MNGTTYHKDMVLVCDVEDDQPVFGKIDDLIVTPSHDCLFVITPLVTSRSQHFHSYEVSASPHNSFFVFRYNDFVDYYPLHLSSQFGHTGKLSVCLKYHVLKRE